MNTSEQDTDTAATIITDNTTELTTEKISETNDFVKKEIKLDLYKVPEIYTSILTDEEIDFYNKFVTAWINYEPVVEFEDDCVLEKVWGMVQECFFLAYGDLDMSTGYDVVDHQVNLHYLSNSKEEHDEIIRQFEERVLMKPFFGKSTGINVL